MSAPPKFATLPDAIAAYLAGRSRRWAEVDGHQVDLHAAAHPCKVSRPHEPQREQAWSPATSPIARSSREAWDEAVALNIAAELSQAVEVLPELAVPSEAGRVLTEDANGAVYYTTEGSGQVKIIGKALRREAVEACLCSAQFHMDPFQPSGVGTFSQAAIGLAWKAITVVVDRTLWKFRDHSVEGRAAEWEDAAKLLMSGWTP